MNCRSKSLIFKCSTLFKPIYNNVRTAVKLSYTFLGHNTFEPHAAAVLLLHGLLGRKRHWRRLGKTIVNITKRSVISVDLRNHGRSPHAAAHQYENLAKDILLLLKKLDLEKTILIGHGMGGRTSMCLSLMEPKKVAGLVIVDISPVSSCKYLLEEFPKVLEVMKAVDFKGIIKIDKARAHAKKHLRDAITEDQLMKAVLSNIKIRRDGKIGWLCNLDVLIKSYGHIAYFPESLMDLQYLGPTLFIGGQNSEFIPADDLPNIRAMFPQAVITYVVKAGHNVHVDDPKAFLELVLDFIKRIEA